MLPDDEPEGRFVAYFRLLDQLGYGPGCDPDHIVRVLLTRGYPRERARDAIQRAMGADPQDKALLSSQGLARLVAMSGMSNAELRGAVTDAWQKVPAASALIKRLSSITVTGGRFDAHGRQVGPLEETPGQRAGVIGDTFAQAVLGEGPDDLTPFADMAALFGTRPTKVSEEPTRVGERLTMAEEEDTLEGLRQIVRSVKFWDMILTTTPLDELAAAAARSRPSAEAFCAVTELKLTDEALDDWAACLAPTTLLLEQTQRVRRDELPD